LIVLSLWVAQDFLAPLCWAVVIALAVWPAYRKYSARIAGGPSNVWAPLSFTILVGLVLFVPVGLAIHQAALESQTLAQSLAHIRENGIAVPEWLPQMPL
jgi:predicted PurR-regulated permease PerM